jgi:hypothetical protein
MNYLNIRMNHQSWNEPCLTVEQFCKINDEIRLKHLSLVATLAANSHNTQPWCFEYSPNKQSLTMYLDTKKVLPVSDVKGRQAVISLGCAMANFETAAKALKCQLEKNILISDSQVISSFEKNIPIVEYKIKHCDLSDTSIEHDKLYRACFSRRVDRGEYDHDKKIDQEILKQIQNLGNDYHVNTILISDWGRKVALAELQSQADSFVINNQEFAEELVNDWIISNDSDSYYGMPGDTFRLNEKQTNKIKERFKNKLGFESDDAMAISQLGKKGILSCQCVGMLTVEKDTPRQWLNAGYVLQMGALIFEANNIAWAVHAGLAEVPQINMLMLRPIAMTSKRPVILFRAGYLKPTEQRSPHSPRVPIQNLWSVKNV